MSHIEGKPPHPGSILEQDFLRPRGISPEDFAKVLGEPWTEEKVKAIIAGQQGVSEKSASDFARVLGTEEAFWTDLQATYFAWMREQREKAEKAPPLKKKRSS